MSLLGAVEAIEAAIERGDLDAAVDAIEAAAEELAVDPAPDARIAARLAWSAASISLMRGDGAGFAAHALDAVELGGDVAPVLGGDLASLVGYLAGWIGGLGDDGHGPVRLETLDASGRHHELGLPRTVVVTGGDLAARVAVARRLAGAVGALIWVDGAAATATDARIAMLVAYHRRAVVVVDGGAAPWLDDLARSDVPVIVLVSGDDDGRARAVLRRGRGDLVVRSAASERAAWGSTIPLPAPLEALVADGVLRARPALGRCAALIGDLATVRALAGAVAERVGATLLAVDLATAGLAAARDAVAADAGVVVLEHPSALVEPAAVAALVGLLRASRAVVLLGAGDAASIPARLLASCATVVAAGAPP